MNSIMFRAASIVYGLTMIVFGIQHFMYAEFVATLVPGWIPLHLFWGYFVGAALAAAGISIIINKMARLACILLGIMIVLFIIFIHIPIIAANFHDGGKITNAFKDIGLACCAFVLASTYPKK